MIDPITQYILEQDTGPVKVNNGRILSLALKKIKRARVKIDGKSMSRLKKGIAISTKQYLAKKKSNARWKLILPFLAPSSNGPYHFSMILSKKQLLQLSS